MAINIEHLYASHVTVLFTSADSLNLRSNDVGTMDEIAERACEVLVKHNFIYATVSSTETGEILMTIERT